MAREDLAAVLVPSADPHLSEYLPERWQGRQWLSGFTGSVGTLVVTADFAGVWADSRYWTQAEAQLAGTGIELMKMMAGQQTAPHVDWLAQNVPAGATVGVDGAVLGVAAARALAEALTARGIVLRTDLDLLDAVWPQRPALPDAARVRARRAARERGARREAGRSAPRDAGEGRAVALHLHARRPRLALQPARRRRQLQPGVRRARADRARRCASLFVADGKVPGALADALARDGSARRAVRARGRRARPRCPPAPRC